VEPKSKKYGVLVCGLIPELLVERVSSVHAAAVQARRERSGLALFRVTQEKVTDAADSRDERLA
jgi:hypothetical protein